MRNGLRRQPIEIRRQVQMGVNAGSLGGPKFEWQVWRDIFAQVEVKRGREHFDTTTKKRISEEVWRFTVRYEEVVGIDPTMKIFHNNMLFDIKAPLPDGEYQRDVVIECTVQDKTLESKALMAFMTDNVPAGRVGVVYPGFTVKVAGGAGGYSFAVMSGALPAGLSLSTSTGQVTGTPSAAVTASNIIISVTDDTGEVAQLPSIDIVVAP